jgi:hypothetical protein
MVISKVVVSRDASSDQHCLSPFFRPENQRRTFKSTQIRALVGNLRADSNVVLMLIRLEFEFDRERQERAK